MLSKISRARSIKIPDFKIHYRTTVTKQVYTHQRHTEQKNRIKRSDTNSSAKSQFIFYRDTKNREQGKADFSSRWC